jgi:hypothetical protein
VKVSDAIEALQAYKPDEHIYIEWWSQEIFDHDPDNPIPVDVWEGACELMQSNPSEFAMGAVYDALDDNISQEWREYKENNK